MQGKAGAADVMVSIEALTKRFGPFTAVDHIGFEVRRGEVLGFLGPNGAGKSTTMKMVTGFLTPSSGTASICGHDVVNDTLNAQRALGYLPEGAPAYGDMTPLGFLRFIARIRRLFGRDAERAIEEAVAATELEAVLEQPIDTLSKGFRRRVGLAQAILHNPPVLIMDEPTDGLDPNQKFEVRKLIARMAPEKAIIISTHILEEVDAICSRALIIDRGEIVADGTPAELTARSRYHNAVSLTVPSAIAGEVREALDGVQGAAKREEALRGDDATFTLFPRDEVGQQGMESDTTLIDAVATLARARNWPVRALHGEPGRLDEVFRHLTRNDTEPVEAGGLKGSPSGRPDGRSAA